MRQEASLSCSNSQMTRSEGQGEPSQNADHQRSFHAPAPASWGRTNVNEPCRHSPTERIALRWKTVKISGASHHNKANSNWERETQKRCKPQRVRNKQNAPVEDKEGIKKQALLKEIGSHTKDIFRMLTKWQQLKKPSSTWREWGVHWM